MMSLFDLRDVCIVIRSLATLDVPMVIDLIGIYVLKGPYCTLTTTNWFLQALSVIPRGSWGDVARRFTLIRWCFNYYVLNDSRCKNFKLPLHRGKRDPDPPLRQQLLTKTVIIVADLGTSQQIETCPRKRTDLKNMRREESKNNWADSDLETSSSSSSSEREQEVVHFLMANQTTDDEVFDLSNTEFTREDLIIALNEMVHEYRKLSQTFEEITAENGCLKNSSVESSTVHLEDTDSLQTELSKLKIKNDFLRTKSCELSSENERLSQVMSLWTKSSISLGKLHEAQKPLNDKSALGFSVGESSSGETSTQSDLAYDKFKKMNFVKASVIHDACESVKYDDQISPKLNHKGKQDVALSARMNEEVTRVSQHFGVLTIGFSSCASGGRSADGLRNQSQEQLIDMIA
ncbi:microtubule-associated protein 70-4 [Dorcoceras hygrometricum]|uniref:Microtubule-associated protein 70-4 n=1 Tax=Dorcoceras hygrometricum TaxID=472368 RepID=A0A2Z7A3H8_9LAMI|nr:microtubule-associated protein 70-4 [Dorcoceras hygrometricum]